MDPNQGFGNSNLSLADRLTQRAVSRMEKHVDARVDQRLQAGQSPMEILNNLIRSVGSTQQPQDLNQTLTQINQLAATPTPSTERYGILPTLSELMSGQFSPAGVKQKPLGFDNAVQLLNYQQNLEKTGLERPKTILETIQKAYDVQREPQETQKLGLEVQKTQEELRQMDPAFKLEQVRKEKEMEAQIQTQTKHTEEVQKEQLESEKTFNQVINLNDNLVSTLKAAYTQQGGQGPIAGTIGNIKAAIGMPNTGNIKAVKAVKRDTAIKYAQILAGGSRGVATLFHNVLDSLPDNKFTSEQAGTTIAELSLTAYALKKGISDLGLSQQQLNSMSPSQFESLAVKERNQLSQDEQNKVYSAIKDRFSNIAPRQSITLEGKSSIQRPSWVPPNFDYVGARIHYSDDDIRKYLSGRK